MTYLGCLSYDEINHLLEVSLSLHLLHTERAMCLKFSLKKKERSLDNHLSQNLNFNETSNKQLVMWDRNAVILKVGLNLDFKVFQETLNLLTARCLSPCSHPENQTHLLSVFQACSGSLRLEQTMTSQICQGKYASPCLLWWLLSPLTQVPPH